jgi:hypothetical protein
LFPHAHPAAPQGCWVFFMGRGLWQNEEQSPLGYARE